MGLGTTTLSEVKHQVRRCATVGSLHEGLAQSALEVVAREGMASSARVHEADCPPFFPDAPGVTKLPSTPYKELETYLNDSLPFHYYVLRSSSETKVRTLIPDFKKTGSTVRAIMMAIADQLSACERPLLDSIEVLKPSTQHHQEITAHVFRGPVEIFNCLTMHDVQVQHLLYKHIPISPNKKHYRIVDSTVFLPNNIDEAAKGILNHLKATTFQKNASVMIEIDLGETRYSGWVIVDGFDTTRAMILRDGFTGLAYKVTRATALTFFNTLAPINAFVLF